LVGSIRVSYALTIDLNVSSAYGLSLFRSG